MSAIQIESLMNGLRDSNGEPLSGGLVYTYSPGTHTNKDTYTDRAMTSAATNPIVLDSNGQAQIYAEGAYKFEVTTSAGDALYEWNDIYYKASDSSMVSCGTATGTANALVATPSPAITSYTDGLIIGVVAAAINTSTTVTINVNSKGAKNVKRRTTSATLAEGDIQTGQFLIFTYNLASDVFILMNPFTPDAAWSFTSSDFLPVTNGAFDIGSNSYRVDVGYFEDLNLKNLGYLQARNYANDANINVLWVDTNNDTHVAADSGDMLYFDIGGTSYWHITSSGDLVDDGATLGDASHACSIFSSSIQSLASGSITIRGDSATNGVILQDGTDTTRILICETSPYLFFNGHTTATSATGSAYVVPGSCTKYWTVNVGGSDYKIALFT